jgi:hypothetical protein
MDRRVFAEWFQERRAIRALPDGKKRILFLDNCGGHADSAELQKGLNGTNTELRFLPPNSTDLCQPADSFVISKFFF